MTLKSILKKASYQISNPTYLDRAEMVMVSDIEKFAQTTMEMRKTGGIMDYLSNPAITAGIGGLATGGGTYLASSKHEGEDEKEFKKRRLIDSLTNGLAGAVVGGAAPIAGKAINSIAAPKEDSFLKGVAKKSLGLGVWGGGGAAGGVAANKWLNRDAATSAITKRIKELEESLTAIDHGGMSGIASAAKRSLSGAKGPPEVEKLIEEAGKITGNVAGRSRSTIQTLLNAAKATEERQAARVAPILGQGLKGGLQGIGQSLMGGKLMLPAIGTAAAIALPTILKKLDQTTS